MDKTIKMVRKGDINPQNKKVIGDAASVVAGPNYNPMSKNINIPKFKSREVSKRTGVDTGAIATKLMNKNKILGKFNKSPGGVIAHEFGHFKQHAEKMPALKNRSRVQENAQSAVDNVANAVKAYKGKDMTRAKREAVVGAGKIKKVITGRSSDILKTEADASKRALETMTSVGMDPKKIRDAGEALTEAMGTYQKKFKPLPDKAKKVLDRLPGS